MQKIAEEYRRESGPAAEVGTECELRRALLRQCDAAHGRASRCSFHLRQLSVACCAVHVRAGRAKAANGTPGSTMRRDTERMSRWRSTGAHKHPHG